MKSTATKVTVDRKSSVRDREAALFRIYAQVLERQPYAYERRLLGTAEKDFLNDKIGVKRFLKILGHSEVYLSEFYENSSNLKFLELCFKHFMGRAPYDREEMRYYCDVLMRDGVKALITELIDSEEYRKHFGCFTVPHPIAETTYVSPKAYLESDILNQEFHGRRGFIVPTMLWHDLGLECDGGHCALQQPQNMDFSNQANIDRVELLQALRRMQPEDLEEVAAALPPQQRAMLSQVLIKSGR